MIVYVYVVIFSAVHTHTHTHTRAHRLSALSPPPPPTSYKLILAEIQKKRPFGMGKYKTLTFAACRQSIPEEVLKNVKIKNYCLISW